MAKSKRTKALDISKKVKDDVWVRDGGRCVICGHFMAAPNAHIIRRSQGGLGIAENIVTLCTAFGNGCHHNFDNGREETKARMLKQITKYMRGKYKGWDKIKRIYEKR